MVIGPAVVFGLLVVFGAGYIITNAVLTKFSKKTRSVQTFYQGSWKNEKRPDEQTEEQINAWAVIGGIATVAITIIILVVVPKDWSSAIWVGLTAIGILFGLLTFLLRGSKTNVKTGEVSTQNKPPEIPYYINLEPNRNQRSTKDELYQNLLAKTKRNKDLADRLIEYERKHKPNASQEELIKNAIERWEHDNR